MDIVNRIGPGEMPPLMMTMADRIKTGGRRAAAAKASQILSTRPTGPDAPLRAPSAPKPRTSEPKSEPLSALDQSPTEKSLNLDVPAAARDVKVEDVHVQPPAPVYRKVKLKLHVSPRKEKERSPAEKSASLKRKRSPTPAIDDVGASSPKRPLLDARDHSSPLDVPVMSERDIIRENEPLLVQGMVYDQDVFAPQAQSVQLDDDDGPTTPSDNVLSHSLSLEQAPSSIHETIAGDESTIKATHPSLMTPDTSVIDPLSRSMSTDSHVASSEGKCKTMKEDNHPRLLTPPDIPAADLNMVSLPTPVTQPKKKIMTPPPSYSPHPVSMDISDDGFVDMVLDYLSYRSEIKPWNTGVGQACRISYILENAQPASDTEAVFIDPGDPFAQLDRGTQHTRPIFATGQQHLPLQTPDQFLSEMYDGKAKVSIQDPTIKPTKKQGAVRMVTVRELKQRFAEATPGEEAWNCLELATHVEDGLRPDFLNGEDFRLLTKLKHPSDVDRVSRHTYQPGWKEVEKWALLAQGGALTEPHQDSHGFSTYITVNHGILGFGWLSEPTPEERESWNRSPEIFIGGRWRYVILRPGRTVYFPAGTVHFVFRLPGIGNTLAFGGHILRCSQIVGWVTTLIDEKKNPNVSNEELSVSAPAYLERVERFVTQALAKGDTARWGGEEACREFLRLKAEFGKTRKAR